MPPQGFQNFFKSSCVMTKTNFHAMWCISPKTNFDVTHRDRRKFQCDAINEMSQVLKDVERSKLLKRSREEIKAIF
jgi:hypothetical protein